LRNIKPSNSESDILALCGQTRRPLWENTRSTGAELAGTHSIRSNIGWRHLNSLLWDSVGKTSIFQVEGKGIYSVNVLQKTPFLL